MPPNHRMHLTALRAAADAARWADDAHMHLDSIELVMDIERECDLTIPNEDAQRRAILGGMHDYLFGALRSRGESTDPDAVWRRLHKVLVETGIQASLVTPSAHTLCDRGLDKLCQLMGDAHRRTRTS